MLIKRGATYYCDITVNGGERVRQSTGTTERKQAQEYHDKLKAALWRQQALGEKSQHLWDEAALRWLREKKDKRSIMDDAAKIEWLQPRLGGLVLSAIDRETIMGVIDEKLDEGATEATANRYISLILAILNRAHIYWDWLDSAPKIPRFTEATKRIRWITHDEADMLVKALPEHLAAIARFALATGLRQSNIFKLKWSQLNMAQREGWIHADEAKGGVPIAVPLNDDAMDVLIAQRNVYRDVGAEDYVFVYEGSPMYGLEHRTWKKALARAGIENFRFHDLRHTWASWHVQAGTSLQKLMELGGWKSLDMVLKYAHLSSKHLANDAGNVVLPRALKLVA